MDGFLNVLKPPGMTSSDVVTFVRRRLRNVKTGHAGTLDPEAAGVLPIMLGRAARLFDYLVDKEKTYVAEMLPGIATDTQDAMGQPIAFASPQAVAAFDEAAVCAVASRLTGRIWQTPPAYSAVHVEGRRAHELARAGQHADIPQRETDVYRIDLTGRTARGGYLLEITCGKGTYIRTLIHDMGNLAGCPSHTAFLLRTRVGVFPIEGACTLEEIDHALETDTLPSLLLPMDTAIMHLPAFDIPPGEAARAKCGNPVPVRGDVPIGVPLRMYLEGGFAGIGVRTGEYVKFSAMLL